MKNMIKIAIFTALFVMNVGIVPVMAHPMNCQNGCAMNGSSCYMQNCEQQTCIKSGCDNTRCKNSKYCEKHTVKRVEPKKNTWGHHGHHGR